MKKYFLFACVAAALVSCSSDEFLGENPEMTQTPATEGAILFQAGNQKASRATLEHGPAADVLGRQFYVYGVKQNSSSTYDLVFNNYSVWYKDGSQSTSNSEGWEYVSGEGVEAATYQSGLTTPPTRQDVPAGQLIKYWDYSSADYWFNAVSAANQAEVADPATPAKELITWNLNATTGQIATATVAAVGEDNTIFYADAVQREKDKYAQNLANGQTHDNGDPVHFTFKRLQSKVRLGFYETVPGYAINEVKFYPAADLAASTEVGFGAASTPAVTLVSAATAGTDAKLTKGFMPAASQTYTITYDYTAAGKATLTNATTDLVYDRSKTFGQLNYTVARDLDGTTGNEYYMGESANAATWAVSTPTNTAAVTAASPYTGSTGNNYWMVLPNESQSASFKIKVDYTLTSLDGSKETIHVKGATAVVPAKYCNWDGNTAYTYLFKISDNSNGTTGDPTATDPAGLYPITFDAVVADVLDATQETITTVADPSITTYAEGSDVTTNNEYKENESIVLNVEGAAATKWEWYTNATAITEQEARYLDEMASPALSWTNIAATDGVYKFTPTGAAGKYVIVRMTYTDGGAAKHAYKVIKIKAADPAPTPSNRR